jgi:hypothetical protein
VAPLVLGGSSEREEGGSEVECGDSVPGNGGRGTAKRRLRSIPAEGGDESGRGGVEEFGDAENEREREMGPWEKKNMVVGPTIPRFESQFWLAKFGQLRSPFGQPNSLESGIVSLLEIFFKKNCQILT